MSQGKNGSEEAKGHADLSRAGAVVDKAIEHLLTNETDPLAVASALLAGSLGLLTQAVGEDATVQVLTSAIASVKNGDLRPDNAEGDESETEADAEPEAQQTPDRPVPGTAKPAQAPGSGKPAVPPAKPLGSLGQIGGHDDDDDDF